MLHMQYFLFRFWVGNKCGILTVVTKVVTTPKCLDLKFRQPIWTAGLACSLTTQERRAQEVVAGPPSDGEGNLPIVERATRGGFAYQGKAIFLPPSFFLSASSQNNRYSSSGRQDQEQYVC